MSNPTNPALRSSEARARLAVRPPPAPINDDAPTGDRDPYLRVIQTGNDLVAKAIELHTDELQALRNEIDALRSEIDRLRAENSELRSMKAEFNEVRARAAESASQVAELGFRITRIAHDRRGDPGRDGEPGKQGLVGAQGNRGPRGEKGEKGDSIVDWSYDLQEFRCTPIYSNGRPGKPIEFRLLLEAAYAAAMITDDDVAAEAAIEDHYRRDHEARIARGW
jgi:hypothetical protein